MSTKASLKNGYDIKDQLKKDGWKWDAGQKAWIEYFSDDMTAEDVERYVRQIPGIRNRGDFSIDVTSC